MLALAISAGYLTASATSNVKEKPTSSPSRIELHIADYAIARAVF